ncbi:hypothetical protein B0H16DRAFT_1455696 [Mycena metata]|uniref:Alpha-type protein kinase domain-containing protein n=1 Tax=Mycena metata TaxID=1033252 RepID=A0AAD7NHQ2_9AGAR|nr:hypothetical protein B0H16DRAFT_1455696 [Mycena metata]
MARSKSINKCRWNACCQVYQSKPDWKVTDVVSIQQTHERDAMRNVPQARGFNSFRQNAVEARTLQKGGVKAPTGSGSLKVAAAKGVSRQIQIYLVPMTSTGTRTEAARILANATRKFPDTVSMTANTSPFVFSATLQFNHTAPSELSVTFSTSMIVFTETTQKYSPGSARPQIPSPTIYLEGLISVTDFETGTATPVPYFVHTEKENRKRKVKTVVNEDGEGMEVLFDVMTHTLNGSSGVGDHGKTGIQNFLKKHICVQRCVNLRPFGAQAGWL